MTDITSEEKDPRHRILDIIESLRRPKGESPKMTDTDIFIKALEAVIDFVDIEIDEKLESLRSDLASDIEDVRGEIPEIDDVL